MRRALKGKSIYTSVVEDSQLIEALLECREGKNTSSVRRWDEWAGDANGLLTSTFCLP